MLLLLSKDKINFSEVEFELEEIKKIGISLNLSEIILFGSRAKGLSTERSDIDIAVLDNNNNIKKFRESVELIKTLRNIDIVDLNNCSNNLLLEEIEKYGIKILD